VVEQQIVFNHSLRRNDMFLKMDVQEYFTAQKRVEQLRKKIDDRVEEVLIAICRACGQTYNDHYWTNCNNDDEPEFDESLLEESGQIECELDADSHENGGDYLGDYSWGFPAKFLYMSDEQIIAQVSEEVRGEIAEDAEQLRKEEEMDREREFMDAEKKRIRAEALSKLTEEERQALGFKSPNFSV
jgi:hypothetical protein